MRHRKGREESGQAIVLLAIAVVALLGFGALALDGGNLYTEQRRAQAAADNAVLSAAVAYMHGTTSRTELTAVAAASAQQNAYDNNLSSNWVTFNYPPTRGPLVGNPEYLEVVITQTVPTALAHIVYGQNPIPLTVFAIAHAVPIGPIMPGYAIAAMAPDCNGDSMISMQGRGGGSSGGTFLYGGGAFVNATCDDAIEMEGGEQFYTDGAAIDVVGGVDGVACDAPNDPAGCNYYPPPTSGVDERTQDPLANTPAAEPPEECFSQPRTLASQITNNNGVNTILPGHYTSLDPGNSFKGTLIYSPGIYCLEGGTMTAGDGAIQGDGVMIYLVDAPASIDLSGSSTRTVKLSAPTEQSTGCTGTDDETYEICRFLGIVVYKLTGYNTCDQNDVEIDFTGQASKDVTGVVYAPYSLVRYGGSGSLLMTGQTIAGCVKFNGNGRIEIYYDPELIYGPPPYVRMDE